MCDTILATPDATADGVMLLGKNSDRQPNEAQGLEILPAANHAPGAMVKCTYISIPQVARTHAVLLSRPFWIWGAEMGANEHGVVIGNEGLVARGHQPPETPALIGMDLLRLALERAVTAAEAVEVITSLLEQYGQGGNCGHDKPAFYNNGYMISDAKDAFVVETIGKDWLVERVRGPRAISNLYTIAKPERISTGLHALMRAQGWGEGPVDDYGAAISDPNREHLGQAGGRFKRATAMLQARNGKLNIFDMMRVLRDHGESAGEGWGLRQGLHAAICMHPCTRADGSERLGLSTGSLVSEVGQGRMVYWVTGTAAPCLSIFKPVLIDVALPAHGPRPTDRADTQALWWSHERFHRATALGDFAGVTAAITTERDALEAKFRDRINAVLKGGTATERAQAVQQCWTEAAAAQAQWARRVPTPVVGEGPYEAVYQGLNSRAGLAL